MILTYLLRGIDLPTIFFILAFGFVVCAAANALGIFAGSLSGSWLIRGLLDAGVLFWLFYMIIGTIGMANGLLMFGAGMLGGRSSWWTGIGMYLLVEVLAIGLLYVLSVAMLSPKPSNRMLVPRLYIMGAWAVTGVIMIFWSYVEKTLWPITGWAIGSGIAFTILTVTALGERDAWSARVRRTIPHNPLLRLGAFVVYTGSAGGIIWCVSMFIATMLVALCFGWFSEASGLSGVRLGAGNLTESCGNMSIIFGYILCYCLTTAFLRITVLKNAPTINLSVIAAFLGMAVCLVPYLIAFFVERNWWSVLPWYLLGSPMVLTMSDVAAKKTAEPILIGWLVLCLLLSTPWVIGQWRRFGEGGPASGPSKQRFPG